MKSLMLTPILLLVLSISVLANGNQLCKGEQATINCLKQNFDVLYSNDYKLFWDIMHKTATKIQISHNISEITTFLSLASVIQGNAEVLEFYSEVGERLCLSNPELCLDALSMLNAQDRQLFIDRIRHPIYSSKEEIGRSLSTYRNHARYHEILDLFFVGGQ